MSIGSWLLVFFNILSLFYCLAWLSDDQKLALLKRLPGRVAVMLAGPLRHDLSMYRRALATFGLPVSVGVGIYTGVLLGAVQSRPFWNTNLVAQLFLFSALSTGCAVIILALSCKKDAAIAEMRMLYTFDIFFMLLELFIVIPYVIHGELSSQAIQNALRLILGGPFTLVFWLFFFSLGLLLPLVIELKEMIPVLFHDRELHYTRFASGATALLILGGGFLLRYVFVYAGQASSVQ
jgi:formate-dependent nitrite reductase membrane component NrfD